MLEVKQLRKYRVPKYPVGDFVPWRQHPGVALAKRGTATAALLMLLDACDGGGTTGPPPVPPDYVTENEARVLVARLFDAENIQLGADILMEFALTPQDTAQLVVDGFNDSLQVGFEYVSQEESDSFPAGLQDHLDSLMDNGGPYIKATQIMTEAALTTTMERFIDTLKARGVI